MRPAIPPNSLADRKEKIVIRHKEVGRSIESLHEVITYLPESDERAVRTALTHLIRFEQRHADALAAMTRLEGAIRPWRQLHRSMGDQQYEPSARSLLDAWWSWHFNENYQPRARKDVDRATNTAISAFHRLIALWERHAFLRDIKLIDALPPNTKNIDLLDFVDEPLPVAFGRIISAVDEHEKSGGNQHSIPRKHEAAELAYTLTWELHSDTGLTAHRAVAALTSLLLNKPITEAAVRRAWDRSLKERPE